MAYEIFRERLQEIREAREFTQTELAEKVGVSKTSISAYEVGAKKPSYEIAASIAMACGTSLDWLCGLYESRENKIDNFSEVLKLFFKVVKSGVIQNTSVGFWFDNDFDKFQHSLYGMMILYRNGSISDELFDLWCNNEIKKYQNVTFDTY